MKYIALLCLVILLTSCSSKAVDNAVDKQLGKQAVVEKQVSDSLHEECCAECQAAFGQSPVGVGSEGVFCGTFMTGHPMSKKCEDYLRP